MVKRAELEGMRRGAELGGIPGDTVQRVLTLALRGDILSLRKMVIAQSDGQRTLSVSVELWEVSSLASQALTYLRAPRRTRPSR